MKLKYSFYIVRKERKIQIGLDFCSWILKICSDLYPNIDSFLVNDTGNIALGIDGWYFVQIASHYHFIYCSSISFLCTFSCISILGNAALVLRSRLKVKVVKEHREKMTVQNGIEENGVVPTNIEKEVGKQIMQYQVRV